MPALSTTIPPPPIPTIEVQRPPDRSILLGRPPMLLEHSPGPQPTPSMFPPFESINPQGAIGMPMSNPLYAMSLMMTNFGPSVLNFGHSTLLGAHSIMPFNLLEINNHAGALMRNAQQEILHPINHQEMRCLGVRPIGHIHQGSTGRDLGEQLPLGHSPTDHPIMNRHSMSHISTVRPQTNQFSMEQPQISQAISSLPTISRLGLAVPLKVPTRIETANSPFQAQPQSLTPRSNSSSPAPSSSISGTRLEPTPLTVSTSRLLSGSTRSNSSSPGPSFSSMGSLSEIPRIPKKSKDNRKYPDELSPMMPVKDYLKAAVQDNGNSSRGTPLKKRVALRPNTRKCYNEVG